MERAEPRRRPLKTSPPSGGDVLRRGARRSPTAPANSSLSAINTSFQTFSFRVAHSITVIDGTSKKTWQKTVYNSPQPPHGPPPGRFGRWRGVTRAPISSSPPFPPLPPGCLPRERGCRPNSRPRTRECKVHMLGPSRSPSARSSLGAVDSGWIRAWLRRTRASSGSPLAPQYAHGPP